MDDETRDVLKALGTGGTFAMAQAMMEFFGFRAVPSHRIMGLYEVAEFARASSRQVVHNWTTRQGLDTPVPFRRLASGPLWDRDKWDEWLMAHPNLDRRNR